MANCLAHKAGLKNRASPFMYYPRPVCIMGLLPTAVIATWLSLASLVLSTVVESSGLSVTLDNVHYFISPFPAGVAFNGSLEAMRQQAHLGFLPVTVVSEPEEDMGALFGNWTVKDDVWQPGFLDTVFLPGVDSGSRKVSYYPDRESTVVELDGGDIPSGPYFLDISTGAVHQVYRLYDDFSGAFAQSLLQRPDGHFQTLSAQVPSAASLTIGVPSRLYFTPTKDKPLAGARIGVKDIFALAGVKRSNGNRAWYGLYPPENQTAPVIQNLIDAGAVIVGLQKLSQFANGEKATADWVDYHSPFNPRGDGYQDTSSSSAGAGSSMASYDWLDLAVGSDTGGSIRDPASNQGVFGHRPSHGLVGLDHVMPMSPSLDTAGFLARDPDLLDIANAAMYGVNYTRYQHRPTYPGTLYTLDLPTDDTPTSRILANFTQKLARFLKTNATTLDINAEWNRSRPSSVEGQTISQLLNLTYTTFITKDQVRLVRDPFYKDYAGMYSKPKLRTQP